MTQELFNNRVFKSIVSAEAEEIQSEMRYRLVHTIRLLLGFKTKQELTMPEEREHQPLAIGLGRITKVYLDENNKAVMLYTGPGQIENSILVHQVLDVSVMITILRCLEQSFTQPK